MIISRTPYRVSFFGGGTDYPGWFREHGGAVLTTTIDKYCYISCRYLPPFFEHKHRIIYQVIENVKAIEEIKHPAVKAVLEHLGWEEGLEIHHDGDLPARSGLGSSSAFTVGLLNALKALRDEFISKDELAKQAIHIEQELIQENVGSQDQIAAAMGGFNRIDFHQDGAFSVTPMIFSQEKRNTLQDSIMLFFTGITRISSEVAQKQVENQKNRHAQLHAMRAMVDEAGDILHSKSNGDHFVADFGRLLHESWKLKRSLANNISNSTIDDIYSAGLKAGAVGGKILGAGGGGFIMFLVDPEKQAAVKAALHSVLPVSIRFDNTGSKIVVYDPQIG